jgi:hypothetical protein
MSRVLFLPLPIACPKPCNKPPFSALTVPLYLTFRGRWLDLAYGIAGDWVLGPKLPFQHHIVFKMKLHRESWHRGEMATDDATRRWMEDLLSVSLLHHPCGFLGNQLALSDLLGCPVTRLSRMQCSESQNSKPGSWPSSVHPLRCCAISSEWD